MTVFKSLTPYRATHAASLDLRELTEALAAAPFTPTLPTQPMSIGWVPPRGEHQALAEVIGGQVIMAARIETRSVPGSAIAKWVGEASAAIERETGRKPGKKETRELKDAALLELLPQAFPKTATVLVWLAPSGLLCLDTSSASAADAVATLVAQTLPVTVQPLQTNMAPATTMTGWLHDGAPDYDEFDLGRACELKAEDGTKAAVRYVNTSIDIPEVKAHIGHGLRAVRLALDWTDKASFTLSDKLVLSGIALEGIAHGGVDAFDADVAITAGTLAPLLADLIAALDGEVSA